MYTDAAPVLSASRRVTTTARSGVHDVHAGIVLYRTLNQTYARTRTLLKLARAFTLCAEGGAALKPTSRRAATHVRLRLKQVNGALLAPHRLAEAAAGSVATRTRAGRASRRCTAPRTLSCPSTQVSLSTQTRPMARPHQGTQIFTRHHRVTVVSSDVLHVQVPMSVTCLRQASPMHHRAVMTLNFAVVGMDKHEPRLQRAIW